MYRSLTRTLLKEKSTTWLIFSCRLHAPQVWLGSLFSLVGFRVALLYFARGIRNDNRA